MGLSSVKGSTSVSKTEGLSSNLNRLAKIFLGVSKIGIVSNIRSLFGNQQTRAVNVYDSANNTVVDIGMIDSFSGAANEYTAMKISALYAGINIIGDAVASLPVYLYRPNAKGRERVEDDYRLRILNYEPNTYTNAFTFKSDAIRNLILRGNAYWYLDKSVTGEVDQLFQIHPDNVTVNRAVLKNGDVDYNLKIMYASTKYIECDLHDTVNVVQNSIDGVVGRGILALANDVLQIAQSEVNYTNSVFSNGASLKGYLASETALSTDAKMNLSNSWSTFYSGANNAGKTAVLENGLKFVPLTLSPTDSKILESRRFTLLEIARFLKLAPHLLGDLERATFSNITEQNLQFLHQTLNPYLRKFEQALNKSMLTEEEKAQGYYFEFDVSQLFRSNIKEMVETYSVGLEKGIFTVNEVRTAFNLPAVEAGDFLYTPLNLGQLKPDGTLLNPNANAEADKADPNQEDPKAKADNNKEVKPDGKDGV